MRNFIDEIAEEMYKGEDFVTLGLNKFYEFLASMEAWETNDIKDKFTPERLLGVETSAGYIKYIHFIKDFERKITTVQLDNKHWYFPESLNFYISDENDETVSFDEYVKLFYDTEGVL